MCQRCFSLEYSNRLCINSILGKETITFVFWCKLSCISPVSCTEHLSLAYCNKFTSIYAQSLWLFFTTLEIFHLTFVSRSTTVHLDLHLVNLAENPVVVLHLTLVVLYYGIKLESFLLVGRQEAICKSCRPAIGQFPTQIFPTASLKCSENWSKMTRLNWEHPLHI